MHTYHSQGIILGYIDNRLKYESTKAKKLGNTEKQTIPTDENKNNMTDDDMECLIDTMKTVLINDEKDVEALKKKLKITREYRNNMLLDKKMDLLETFPYFFIEAEMVTTYICSMS